MNKKRIRVLHTARLTLRPFKRWDAKHVFKWASDEEVARYMTWNAHKNIKESRLFVAKSLKDYENNPYHWVIVQKGKRAPIGSIGVMNPDFDAKSCSVGYCLNRGYWHRGIMTEALGEVLRFLLDEEGFERVSAEHNVLNPNSGKVMRKCGMSYTRTETRAIAIKRQEATVDCYELYKADKTDE